MRKTDELQIKKTFLFAKECYGDKTLNTGLSYVLFCQRVGERAENIVYRLYQEARPDYDADNKKDNIAAVVHGSLLCDVLNVSSCAFENVADATNVQVASLVAAISRDYRLVETKRDMEFRGRLSQSSLAAQIVFVARVICFAQATAQLLEDLGLTITAKVRKNVAQMDADLLAVSAANKYSSLRMHVHAARKMLVWINQRIKTLKQAAKLEKLVLQNTKTLRELGPQANKSAEAVRAGTDKTKRQVKGKKKYASKKRASESDSN